MKAAREQRAPRLRGPVRRRRRDRLRLRPQHPVLSRGGEPRRRGRAGRRRLEARRQAPARDARRSSAPASTGSRSRSPTTPSTPPSRPGRCARSPTSTRALRELRRVLKPGGTLHFVEHGLAPDEKVRAWQHRLNPVQNRLFGGCNLNRPTVELLQGAGFEIAAGRRLLREGLAEVPRGAVARRRALRLSRGTSAPPARGGGRPRSAGIRSLPITLRRASRPCARRSRAARRSRGWCGPRPSARAPRARGR